MNRPMKRPRESYTEQVQIVLSSDINGAGRLFGGRLMEWIDIVASVAARRHACTDVITACIDQLQFLGAAHINDTIFLSARLTWVGNTSMEVRVDTYVESLDGTRVPANRAYLLMVALDKDGKPTQVPGLLPETPEEHAEWEKGEERRKIRQGRKL